MNQIIPAILTDDKSVLEKMLSQVSEYVSWVQIDIMDGLFVDNTSISLDDLEGIDYKLDLSIHLMVESPQSYFTKCKAVGAKRVIFHAKASNDYKKLLDQLDQLGLKKGIAIDPDDDIEAILPVKDLVDVFLIMGVVPGKGGQKFIKSTLDKVTELRQVAPDIEIIVDGGVGFDNILALKKAGANSFVVGSTIFESDNIKKTIKELQEKIN